MRRTATASGFSSGSQVSSWKARKISSIVRPRLSSSRQPVSSSATGFRYSTRPCASVVITPSPIDCSVICALSFSRNSASSYSLRSVMSSSTPIRRRSRPWSSTRALARPMTQRHSPSRVLEPVHALEHRRLAGDVIAHRGRHARQVLRVHHAVPVRRGDHVALGEAEHALSSAARTRCGCSARRSPTGRRSRRAAPSPRAPACRRAGPQARPSRGRRRGSCRPA